MADSTERARPNRLQALLSVVGGGLMIAAYFVPETPGTATPGVTSAAAPLTMLTLWDGVLRAGYFTKFYDQRTYSYISYQPQAFSALMAAVPLLMGAVIVAL